MPSLSWKLVFRPSCARTTGNPEMSFGRIDFRARDITFGRLAIRLRLIRGRWNRLGRTPCTSGRRFSDRQPWRKCRGNVRGICTVGRFRQLSSGPVETSGCFPLSSDSRGFPARQRGGNDPKRFPARTVVRIGGGWGDRNCFNPSRRRERLTAWSPTGGNEIVRVRRKGCAETKTGRFLPKTTYHLRGSTAHVRKLIIESHNIRLE